jgi:Contractile injection system tube protein
MSDISFSAGATMDLSGAQAGVSVDFGGDIGSAGISIDTNLKIIEMMMPINFVSFDYNPKSFTVKRATRKNTRGRSGGGGASASSTNPSGQPASSNFQYLGAMPRQITFTALLSDEGSGVLNALADMTAIGGGVRARCDMLMNWVVGGPSTLLGQLVGMLGIGLQNSHFPPMLILQWGDPMRGFLVFGNMIDVKCDFKRFDAIGNPIRAEVTCTFQEAASDLLSLLTNPTSGGVSGGQAHTLTQGENLQTIATERYGRPAAWRQVAEANGIDDPVRVRPGRVLNLPPPQEVTG